MRALAHKETSKDTPAIGRLVFSDVMSPVAEGLTYGWVGRAPVELKPVCPCGGGCPRCNGVIQAKLKIGQPDDVYEQEADRIADRVMRMPEPSVQAKPT